MEWILGLIAAGLPVTTMLLLPASNLRRIVLVSITLLFGVRYFSWRLVSFPWLADNSQMEWLWWLVVLVVEAAVLVEVGLFLCSITWLSSRKDEANQHEQRLRRSWQEDGDRALPSIDIFITTFNEGLEVLEKSILGALRVSYPRFHVWVLDDGRRPWLAQYCQMVGAQYLSRYDNSGAKAGNINHALNHSKADLVMILDADFICFKDALWRVAGFFQESRVATVQTPQNFYNPDALQHNLGITSFWRDEQSYFFRLVARGRDSLGVAFCCGSCSIHRRSVLESVGGFPTDSITEDILLTIKLCAQGWRTIYFEEPISIGLAAESLGSYFIQRKRWARGGIQVVWLMLRKRGLTLIQRIFFFPYSWITQYTSRLFFQVIPIIFFVIGFAPLPSVEMQAILFYQVPFLISLVINMLFLSEKHYLPVLSEAIGLFTSFELAPEIIAAMIKPFGRSFSVTPKGSASMASMSNLYLPTLMPASILLAFNVVILFQIIFAMGASVSASSQALLAYGCGWCCLNVCLLLIAILFSVQRPQPRLEHRMLIGRPCTIAASSGNAYQAILINLSVSGALCRIQSSAQLGNDYMVLKLENGVQIPIQTTWTRDDDQRAMAFSDLSIPIRQEIISYAFGGSFDPSGQPAFIYPIKTLKKIMAEILNLRPKPAPSVPRAPSVFRHAHAPRQPLRPRNGR